MPKLTRLALSASLVVAGVAIGAIGTDLAGATRSAGERPVTVSITSCRLVDTRPASQVGPRSAPLGVGDIHTIDAQESGTPCAGEIPSDAVALTLNVTAVGATEPTFLTIWDTGDRPTSSSLNPRPGQGPVPNAVTTPLASDQTFKVFNLAGSVDVVVDVTGYLVDHDHDDRYLAATEAQRAVSVQFAEGPGVVIDDDISGRPPKEVWAPTVEIPAGTTVVELTSSVEWFWNDGGPIGIQARGTRCWLELDDDTTRVSLRSFLAQENLSESDVVEWSTVVESATARTLEVALWCRPPADGSIRLQLPSLIATSYPS